MTNTTKFNVLVLEDDRDSRAIISIYLKQWGYNVFEASNSTDASNQLVENDIDIMILDWFLPGISGVDFCKKIRNEIKHKYIYAIVITGKKSRDDVVDAMSKGADDYLVKPFNFEELKYRLKAGERVILFHKNQRLSYDRLYYESLIDSLTGIFNRKAILEKLESEFERNKRVEDKLSLILADIDHFKKINDNFGHLAGDEVLKRVGQILNETIRDYDSVGRYGGEEFLMVLPHTDINRSLKIANRIKDKMANQQFYFNKKTITITMSFGISISQQAKNSKQLILFADKALYQAKKNGRNRIEVYKETEMSITIPTTSQQYVL